MTHRLRTATLEGTHPEGSEVTMPSQDQEDARRVRTQSLAVQTQHQHWLYALGKEGNKTIQQKRQWCCLFCFQTRTACHHREDKQDRLLPPGKGPVDATWRRSQSPKSAQAAREVFTRTEHPSGSQSHSPWPMGSSHRALLTESKGPKRQWFPTGSALLTHTF